MLLHLGALLEALGARRDDEGGVAARAELAVDRGDHHVDVGDPAVGRPGLLAVDHPLVLRLVVLGGGPVARDVRAGVRLGRAEGADLDVVLVAEALRHPLDHLLGRARAVDPGDRERRAEDRHADPGVAPEELLVHDREGEPGRIGPELRDRLEAVEPDLRRLLHHRPGELLLLVPLVRGRPHRLLGEPVRPLPDVLLVLGELEREGRVRRPRSRAARWPQPRRPSPRPLGRSEPAVPARSPSSPGSPSRLKSSSSPLVALALYCYPE